MHPEWLCRGHYLCSWPAGLWVLHTACVTPGALSVCPTPCHSPVVCAAPNSQDSGLSLLSWAPAPGHMGSAPTHLTCLPPPMPCLLVPLQPLAASVFCRCFPKVFLALLCALALCLAWSSLLPAWLAAGFTHLPLVFAAEMALLRMTASSIWSLSPAPLSSFLALACPAEVTVCSAVCVLLSLVSLAPRRAWAPWGAQ